jgi:threonine/homoserine/homoserine lactone efflux protein
MAVGMKEKILSIWLVIVVTVSLVINHFWASTVYVLGGAVASSLVALPGLAKLVARICGVHFLA